MTFGARSSVRIAGMLATVWAVGIAQAAPAGWVGTPTEPARLDGAVTRLGFAADDVANLAAGRATARQIETEDESELGAVGVVVLPARVDDVVESFRDLSILRRSGMAVCAGRFSATPTLDDLACLDVPADDLVLLPKAKLGASDVKLSDAEIAALGRDAGPCSDVEYKRALMRRVVAWQQHKLGGLGNYADKKRRVVQSDVTGALLANLALHRPEEIREVDSFEYWAVEQFGSFRPLVDVNSVSILSGPGIVRIETTQLYASHYCNGLVTSVDLIPVQTANGQETLMRLTFRVQMDSLGGFFGGLKRHIGRGRVVEQVASGLEKIRGAVKQTV
jgi:hypothetical protein